MRCCVRTLVRLWVLGGVVSALLVWSHSHPHPVWSLWTLSDAAAIGLLVVGLRLAHRRSSAQRPTPRMAVIIPEPRPAPVDEAIAPRSCVRRGAPE
ncbi:hypothetical protein ABT337_07800 [Saccharopolyspora hirsuta]|uniref:hypothetical protein n=1 Tax=Saccharopolyspora hirsuta TaxID=1837 RepID=UPI00331AD44D